MSAMARAFGSAVICAALLGGVALAQSPRSGVQLITDEEAKLPPQKGAVAAAQRGITRGPKIQIPDQETALQPSPMRFQVNFQAFGGSKVDPDAVKVTYLKAPNVDLTPRIKPFVAAGGIDMPDAQLPPGEHLLRIDIKDSEGRPATASFMLKIAQ